MHAGNTMKMFYTLLLLCNFSAVDHVMATTADSHNWQLLIDEDPLSRQTACLMVSASKQTEDGQANTAVSLVYNGEVFMARTESNIDLSYSNLGLQVDNKKPHTIDRLYKKTGVVFETQAQQIRDEFIKGRNARLTLGFWPTWPKTRSFMIEFDLRGFTRVYQAFKQCQKTGKSA